MPNYIAHDYMCLDCGHVFIANVLREERDEVQCETCSGDTNRLISAPYVAKHANTSKSSQRGDTKDLLEALSLKEKVVRDPKLSEKEKDSMKKEYKRLKGEPMKGV